LKYSTLVADNYYFPSQRLSECILSRSVLAVRLKSGTRQGRALSNRMLTNPTPLLYRLATSPSCTPDISYVHSAVRLRSDPTSTVRFGQACQIQNRLRPISQTLLGTSGGNMSYSRVVHLQVIQSTET